MTCPSCDYTMLSDTTGSTITFSCANESCGWYDDVLTKTEIENRMEDAWYRSQQSDEGCYPTLSEQHEFNRSLKRHGQ